MVGLIEVIVLVLLLATAGGRLLGVRLPLRRALLTGLPGRQPASCWRIWLTGAIRPHHPAGGGGGGGSRDRDHDARRAGLRTNALVATGATLFVLYSDISGSANSTQVAAYVVSGIGFLGGGVILRDGFNVRGLNTAATLWSSAAAGVLAASGYLTFAVIGTFTVLAVHILGRPLGRLIDHDSPAEEAEGLVPYELHVTCRPKSEQARLMRR